VEPAQPEPEPEPEPEPDPQPQDNEAMADQAPAATAAQAGAFALTPAAANIGVLDYTRREHTKIYEAAVLPLAGDKFDGTDGQLPNFLTRLRERAKEFTWLSTVCHVKVADGPPAVFRNLVDDYGNISLEQVRAHATEYATTETRTRQNSVQMQQCIFASLTQAFQNRVNLQKKSWYIDDQADGACLLKVVISLSYPDTPATTSHIRTELTKSDEKMIELNFDIEKFNDWVNDQVAQLAARGAQTTDLMENLFKGYEKVPDKEFLAYHAQKRMEYDEGKPITTEELMKLMRIKFQNKRRQKTWNVPTAEEEQIIALAAEVKSLRTQNQNLRRGPSKNTPAAAGGRQNKKGGNRSPKKGRAGKANQARDGDYLNATGKWSWLKTAPKPGEKTSKSFEGKLFFWCKNHARWGRHAVAECRKGQESPKADKHNNKNQPDKSAEPRLRFAESLAAVVGNDTDDEQI
jgi:hypothetical protein